ncbi:MAG: pantoate--beta-alanine ligase [Gammaproteobacteria bacterium SG8_31]|jgi:pantoate--beta-alanine ligase|nr:MAG: pantoate--beta-alanine ligase [Gammaproteobacteria bacterium SG8_31]
MDIYSRIEELRATVRGWRRDGKVIGFVPTMGNLHDGHLSLIDMARQRADKVVASIFVNPLQFGEGEDFSSYPRTEERDRRLLEDNGCDGLFMPAVKELYPEGGMPVTIVEVPELSNILCGAHRPGHFRGVTTVVAKLFNLVEPDLAVFGEKDYQQLVVIRRMVEDLCFPVEIVPAPTGREPDGLAMSSRNQYLTESERRTAPSMYRELQRVARVISEGERDLGKACDAAVAALWEEGFRPDYFEVRRASDLAEVGADDRDLVILAAARLGRARLIDNVRLRLPE